ncbi:MAG: hypothetical protein HGA47_15795 [Zoogloea sp.]|nr:hypothetical protein [Zoogloea sp.]
MAMRVAVAGGMDDLDVPERAGMKYAGDYIFVDPSLAPERQAAIPAMVYAARERVERLYGSLQARPNLVFCGSDECFRYFGGMGLGFSNGRHLVIAPRGRRVAIVAHELAHVELAVRLGGFAQLLESVPQWFDEGQAVMVSGAEEYSEEAWLAATRNGRDAPDLSSLESVASWNRLTGSDGEHMQITYGTAKREVERWFAVAGGAGFLQLVHALADGEDFSDAYRRIESAARPR